MYNVEIRIEEETRANQYFLTDHPQRAYPSLFDPNFGDNSPHLDGNIPYLQKILVSILSDLKIDKLPKKLPVELMEKIILSLCQNQFVSVKELSVILDRDCQVLRDNYLTRMLAHGMLEQKYPKQKKHPEQAYKTTVKKDPKESPSDK